MKEVIVLALGGVGFFFVLSATIGALRFPDVFTRMHAITKAGTLGVGLTMAGAAVHFGDDISLATRALAVIVFALVTAPASAQMIGRAAYLSGARKAPATHIDQLRERYERPEELFSSRPSGKSSEPVPEEH